MKADIDWVTPTLAVGGGLPADAMDALDAIMEIRDAGVTTVISLRDDRDDSAYWSHFPDVAFARFGTDDYVGHFIPSEVFDGVVALVRERDYGKVLVHCEMGINRSPSAAFAILLEQGNDPVTAFEMVRSARAEAAIVYALDALVAHQKRHRYHDTPLGVTERRDLRTRIVQTQTPQEQRRIARVVKAKHGFDLRALF